MPVFQCVAPNLDFCAYLACETCLGAGLDVTLVLTVLRLVGPLGFGGYLRAYCEAGSCELVDDDVYTQHESYACLCLDISCRINEIELVLVDTAALDETPAVIVLAACFELGVELVVEASLCITVERSVQLQEDAGVEVDVYGHTVNYECCGNTWQLSQLNLLLVLRCWSWLRVSYHSRLTGL